ncbi:hypothetical protein ACOSP7_029821 [Xanthoceras sorbifolium]
MENTRKESETESFLTGVFEIPGEPAVVINGLPDMYPSDNAIVPFCTVTDAQSPGDAGFGEWLEGREVRKLFGNQYYSGTVTQFDKESGWYRVVYEDGDFEDLDWHELEEVLQPLDITVPLKTLAMKIVKKNQKPIHKSVRSAAQSQYCKAKVMASKGKNIEAQKALVMKFDNSSKVTESVAPSKS